MYKQRPNLQFSEKTKSWIINLPNGYKDIHSQSGIQIIIDPGFPTGNLGNFFSANDVCGLENATITIRGYDDMTGWISSIRYKIPELLEALSKILPENAVEKATIIGTINEFTKQNNLNNYNEK